MTLPADVGTPGPWKRRLVQLAGMALLAIPAAAIWHPATVSEGPANLLVFWSWLYVPIGLLMQFFVFAVCFFSRDEKVLGKMLEARNRKALRLLGFLLGGAWMLGAVYRGWMWTGGLLAFGWILGPVLGWLAFSSAEIGLKNLELEDAAA